MAALPETEVEAELGRRTGWERSGDEIVRVYELDSFRAVIALVDAVAQVAEAANHHPDLDIRYNKLRVALSTHDQGGITARDFALADQIDALAS
ncbi:MAG TPA: 4a-hydroxytetrahydrobiopterin dehydratase [Acidimicrobiia bacterium]|nr:4a-hydroxytetrahydrobiopterin dehydratase [Acidimicrobiia bacterium]